MADTPVVDRDYIDNFSVKEYATNELVPKYFPEIDTSLRTVGTIGYITELITNYGEDAFNTASVLFREIFPNRARLSESIYSHAAIFQLSDIFATAAYCKFLLVLEEDAILQNKLDDRETGISKFYIDKNTTIYVEDIPFTLDYDICINIAKKSTTNNNDYLFTANYIFNEYKNSISNITDPYIKVRRSSDGFVALEIDTHQCVRLEATEQIISNNIINYPVVDIDFDGTLAGFDVLYKGPEDDQFTQMETKVLYSIGTRNPFCYFQMVDDDTLRLSFNSKDNYFVPEYNSEIKVILYQTLGEDGNFEIYNGTNISLTPYNENYDYKVPYLTAAQPIGGAGGGLDAYDLESLQALTVESYRTATALTTENDLQEYFTNFRYRYGDSYILFLKKRDDVYERVYSAFTIIKKDDYIYKTNTLNLALNIYDMKHNENDVFLLEPGTLFASTNNSGYAEFLIDSEIHSSAIQEYEEKVELFKKALELNPENCPTYDVAFVETTHQDQVPIYLRRECSLAQYMSRMGIDNKRYVYDLSADDITELDNHNEGKFLLINPFLLRFTKDFSLVSTYLTYSDSTSVLDYTAQTDSYVQFVTYSLNIKRDFSKSKKYTIKTKISPNILVDSGIHPIIHTSEETSTNDAEYVLNDPESVVLNDLRVFLVMTYKNTNVCFLELYPSDVSNNTTQTFEFTGEFLTDDHITEDGRFRILSRKIYLTKSEKNSEEGTVIGDGSYYRSRVKAVETDPYIYDHYDAYDNLMPKEITEESPKSCYTQEDIDTLLRNGDIYPLLEVHNMTKSEDILVQMHECECKLYTIYKREYRDSANPIYTYDAEEVSSSTLQEIPAGTGKNIFKAFDEIGPDGRYKYGYANYTWTNEYTSGSEPITFIRPLDSVRTYLYFEDYTEATKDDDGYDMYAHNIMDAQMKNISFLRASIAKDSDMVSYFYNSFLSNYKFLENIIQTNLRNATNLDVKFYNTYGYGRYLYIGDNEELLNSVNISMSFDMWFDVGTDLSVATLEVKNFIKSEVESINEDGVNNLYISNLMRKIETNFAYVDHIRFNNINGYPTVNQSIKQKVEDLMQLSVTERRDYVPELIMCDIEDITINEYYTT